MWFALGILALAVVVWGIRAFVQIMDTLKDDWAADWDVDGEPVAVVDLEVRRRVSEIPEGLRVERTNKTLEGKSLPLRRLGGR